MKKTVPVIAVCLLVVLSAGVYLSSQSAAPAKKAEKEVRRLSTHKRPLSVDADGKVRAFYITVDRDGVYFGDQRVEFDIAIGFLDEMAKKEHVQNICFFATDLAKYGDVVHIYLGIDRSKYFVSSFPTRPATNTRKWPLIGVFQKGDDSWYDEPNGGEIL